MAYWIKITYERNDYVIDLDRIAAFCHAASGKVSFALPDGNTIVTVTQQNDPDGYERILDYIEKRTGYSLS